MGRHCFTDIRDILAGIDPSSVISMLEGRGFRHFRTTREDIWKGNRDGYWVTVPVDLSLSDYTDAMLQVFETVAAMEKSSVSALLAEMLSCRSYIDAARFFSLLGNGEAVFDMDRIRAAADASLCVRVFDTWNPWPGSEPPANTKLRVTLECIADSRKCRDAVYLASKPEGYTRFEYTSPGWYMSLTGKRIEDGKVKAWMREIPFRGELT